MIELPEGINLSKQLNKEIKGKTVKEVYLPTHVHKFTFFHEDVKDYPELMRNRIIKEIHSLFCFNP